MPSATVRILCEARSQSRTVRDAATTERPFYWRGSSVRFELALTDNDGFLLAAGVGTIIVEVKRLTALPIDDALMRKEYFAADCDETFAAADWTAGTKALLTAAFTVGEAAILPGTYRLIVRHQGTGEDEGTETVHLSTELQVLDPQSGSEGIDPPPAAWAFLDVWPVIRHDTPQDLSDTQQFRALRNLDLAGEEASGGTFRLIPNDAGGFDAAIWNATAGQHQRFWIEGDPGDERFVFAILGGGGGSGG